jgi:uncharacterized protein (UPF0276 family)
MSEQRGAVRLTVNYSEALHDMARAGTLPPIDGIEVGPWFTPDEIVSYRQELAYPFHLHADNFAARGGRRSQSLRRVAELLACTENEWLSVHIDLLPLFLYRLSTRFGIHLPPPDPARAVRRFVQRLGELKRMFGLPILVENLPALALRKYRYTTDPGLLAEVVEAGDCGLLLDLAHARLAAVYRGQAVEEYVRVLPLERVRQVHVSGIRQRNGVWYDAHEPMLEEDYTLLEWALARCRPEMVTLEYYREEGALREQLGRLRRSLS